MSYQRLASRREDPPLASFKRVSGSKYFRFAPLKDFDSIRHSQPAACSRAGRGVGRGSKCTARAYALVTPHCPPAPAPRP